MKKWFVIILATMTLGAAEPLKPFTIYANRKFTIPVKEKYRDKLVHYLVPNNYREKRLPLIVFLHGGGPTSPPEHPLGYLRWDGERDHYWGGLFSESGAVVAAPHSFNGWWTADVEEYLADIIQECVVRYNIDPERVYLFGWSMGGGGAYYAMNHFPDHFAGIAAGAGNCAGVNDFKNLGKTKAYIIHGGKDAVYRKRPRYSDAGYALVADTLMKRDQLDHLLLFNPEGGHDCVDHKANLWKFWEDVKGRRRDLSRICLSGETKNRGWISVEAFGPGKIAVDYIYGEGQCGKWNDWNFTKEEFDKFKVATAQKDIPGGQVDAAYLGGNKFDIKTRNVAKLTVRMNAEMVDYAKPVEIAVNGEKAFVGKIVPDKKNAEEYRKERLTPGQYYDGKVTIEIDREERARNANR